MGMQAHLARFDVGNAAQMAALNEQLRAVKLDKDFIQATTGGGKNSPGPLNQRITFVRGRLAQVQ